MPVRCDVGVNRLNREKIIIVKNLDGTLRPSGFYCGHAGSSIGGIRLIKILPTLALVALVAQFLAMRNEARVKTAQIGVMEQAIEARDAEIRSLEEEAVALVERHLKDLAAVQAELDRQIERAG